MLHLLAAAIATPCAFDETAAPAPEAGLYHSQCYKFVGVASSVHECAAKCGPGAAPVCPVSEEEMQFVWTVATAGRIVHFYWLGWYRNESGSLSSCVSEGADADFAIAQDMRAGYRNVSRPCAVQGYAEQPPTATG